MFSRGRKEPPPEAAPVAEANPERILFDGASGFYQPWYFRRRMGEEVARCARYGRQFALIVWEPRLLPGEALEDEAITRTGAVIAGGVRKTDFSTRLERSRFACLLIEAGYDVARMIAHRVKSELSLKARTGAGPWRAGMAVFPDDGVDASALTQVALRRLNDDLSAAA